MTRLAIAALFAVLLPPLAAEAADQPLDQAPGYYRFTLGEYLVTVLSDGGSARDFTEILSDPELARASYDAAHVSLPSPVSINTFLIDTGTQQVLIDTGTGATEGPTGQLLKNMAAAGYSPDDVDAVLITHRHGDHMGGLSTDGKRQFPNATVYVDKRDLGTDQTQEEFGPYADAGKLEAFDGATDLLPGIRSASEYGHTPGQSGYVVESAGETLLVWGDVVHSAFVQFDHPGVTIKFDTDPEMAAKTRLEIFNKAAETGTLIGAAHISFPGLGTISKDGDAFRWTPAPYRPVP